MSTTMTKRKLPSMGRRKRNAGESARCVEQLGGHVETIGCSRSLLPPSPTAVELLEVEVQLRARYEELLHGHNPALSSGISSLFGARHSALSQREGRYLVAGGCPSPERVESAFAAAGAHSQLGYMLQWFSRALVSLFTHGLQSGVDFPQQWEAKLRDDAEGAHVNFGGSSALQAHLFELQGFSTLYAFIWGQLTASECFTEALLQRHHGDPPLGEVSSPSTQSSTPSDSSGTEGLLNCEAAEEKRANAFQYVAPLAPPVNVTSAPLPSHQSDTYLSMPAVTNVPKVSATSTHTASNSTTFPNLVVADAAACEGHHQSECPIMYEERVEPSGKSTGASKMSEEYIEVVFGSQPQRGRQRPPVSSHRPHDNVHASRRIMTQRLSLRLDDGSDRQKLRSPEQQRQPGRLLVMDHALRRMHRCGLSDSAIRVSDPLTGIRRVVEGPLAADVRKKHEQRRKEIEGSHDGVQSRACVGLSTGRNDSLPVEVLIDLEREEELKRLLRVPHIRNFSRERDMRDYAIYLNKVRESVWDEEWEESNPFNH